MSFPLTGIILAKLIVMIIQLVNINGNLCSIENKLNVVQETSQSALITAYLPRNFVKNGSVDYTSSIQLALIKNSDIIFPNFPILINDNGLEIPSGRTLTFLKGSELRMKPSSKRGYDMLKMSNVHNVTLIEPVLKGDRYEHLGNDGEWGMGISINGGSDITVLNPNISEMWGDGIYIGPEKGVIPRRISVKNAILTHNRRDGISIIAVDGLILESPYAAFSNGTLPMGGIVIEPDNSRHEIKNVLIINPRTQENAGTGILVDFGNLMGGGKKNVSVTVLNHYDLKSKRAVKAMSRVSDGKSTIKGDLNFVNPRWYNNSETAISTILFGVNDVHLTIKNPIIKDIKNYQLSKKETVTYLTYKTRINRDAWHEIKFSTSWPKHFSD